MFEHFPNLSVSIGMATNQIEKIAQNLCLLEDYSKSTSIVFFFFSFFFFK